MYIILVVLLLMAIFSGPWYPYSHTWGYYPSASLLGLLIIILVVWIITRGPGTL
jgi:uncharacterized membrane protein YphA (DoxX/SURF4 family)